MAAQFAVNGRPGVRLLPRAAGRQEHQPYRWRWILAAVGRPDDILVNQIGGLLAVVLVWPVSGSGARAGRCDSRGPDYSRRRHRVVRHMARRRRLSHGLTPRVTLSGTGGFSVHGLRPRVGLAARSQDHLALDGEVSYQGTRNTNVHSPYRYRDRRPWDSDDGRRTSTGSISGCDLLSAAVRRRAGHFSASGSGSSAVSTCRSACRSQVRGRLYRVRGDAMLATSSRSWEARGSYSRGLEYVPGLRATGLDDGVYGCIKGSLTRTGRRDTSGRDIRAGRPRSRAVRRSHRYVSTARCDCGSP